MKNISIELNLKLKNLSLGHVRMNLLNVDDQKILLGNLHESDKICVELIDSFCCSSFSMLPFCMS